MQSFTRENRVEDALQLIPQPDIFTGVNPARGDTVKAGLVADLSCGSQHGRADPLLPILECLAQVV